MAPGDVDPPPPEKGGPPDDDGRSIEERFAEIVREFGDIPTLDDAEDPRPEVRGSAAFPAAPGVRPVGPRDWPTTPEVEELEEAETHFTPPDPPPVLGREPLLTLAWGLVVGVPLLLLIAVMFVRPFPTVIGQVGAGAFIAGLGILVWRMPHRRDEDDHDPGAVV